MIWKRSTWLFFWRRCFPKVLTSTDEEKAWSPVLVGWRPQSRAEAGFLVSQSVGISLIPAHGGAFLLLETDACWVTAVWAVSYNWHGCCVGICICPSLLSSPYPRTQGTPKMEQWRVGCALSSRVLTRPDLIVPPNLPVNFLDWWLRGGEAINKQF